MARKQRKRRSASRKVLTILGHGARGLAAALLRLVRSLLRLTLPLATGLLRGAARSARAYNRWVWARPRRAIDSAVLATVLGVLLIIWLKPPIPLNLEDSVDCLVLNIYHEARGEPPEGQLAVAKVVMNRVAHPRFPDSVCAVIKQGGEWPRNNCQFSWWCDGRSDAPNDEAALKALRGLARDVVRGRRGDPSDGALWYHAASVAPDWRTAFEAGPTIGDHIFYRPKDDTW